MAGVQTPDAIRTRRMTRRFDPTRPVDDALLRGLLDLARFAPTAGHAQGVDLVVLTDPVDREAYWATTAPSARDAWVRGVSTAPVLVVVCADPRAYADRYGAADKVGRAAGWTTPWWDTDAAMAALAILLGAHDAGLGGLWCGIPGAVQPQVRRLLGIPEQVRLVGLLALGHRGGDTPRSPSLDRHRRTHDEVVHRGRW